MGATPLLTPLVGPKLQVFENPVLRLDSHLVWSTQCAIEPNRPHYS
jgi:hypothetical protein